MIKRVYVNMSMDFSSVFREHVAMHENPHGISINKKTLIGVNIVFSAPPPQPTKNHGKII
jgi:hypothetical protein